MASASIKFPYTTVSEMIEKLLRGTPVSKIKMTNTLPQPVFNDNEQPSNPQIKRHKSAIQLEMDRHALEQLQIADSLIDTSVNGILSPQSASKLQIYLKSDKGMKMELEYNDDDKDYIPPVEKDAGVFMENYICSELECPLCPRKLYKYVLSNQPVVDLYCMGNHPIKYFQVKTTKSGSIGPDPDYKDYFHIDLSRRTKNYIHTGSYRYGKLSHNIKPSDKNLWDGLIGYILIEYDYTDTRPNEYILKSNKSYVIIPNLNKSRYGIDMFYDYLSIQGTVNPNTKKNSESTVITFNQDNMECMTFENLYHMRKSYTINRVCQFDIDSTISTPDKIHESTRFATRLFRDKYLKYKNKYLELRSNSKYLNLFSKN